MAGTIIYLVLNKLADTVVKEVLFVYGVYDKVERVQRELTWIQSFLEDADTKRCKDERVKCWVNEVTEVGYLIEDTLDKFLIKVGGDSTSKGIGKLPMKLIAKHNLGIEFDKIQERIGEISANTTRYGIEGLKDSTIAPSNLPVGKLVIPDIDETEVIGFEIDMRTIAEKLIDSNMTRRSVISIVGAGGSGKTTLAKEVYNRHEIKIHFAIRLWLTISQDYKLIDVLIKMLEGIGQADSEMRQKGEEYLITKLYNSMKDKQYLVVLDDVWSSDLWTQLQVALPNSNNSSRLLITTRFLSIVEEPDAICKQHEIIGLNEEESQQLLLKKILPNPNECPNDLLPFVPQLAKKCGGSPLALVVLGGFLSKKIANYNVWYKVMQNIDWHTDGSRCMAVISTSYEDLPIHLKTCFMYFAGFPEDHEIKATNLIRLWTAEGFIANDTSTMMEDIAESYLEELVQRCMVQVSSRSVVGKIKYCHVHDLLREVAIQKAKEGNFLTVFSRNDTRLCGSYSTRRVSLHKYNKPFKHAGTNLRTLNSFGECHIQSWERFRMLRVLNIQGKNVDGPLNFGQNLQYQVTRNGLERTKSFFNNKAPKGLKASTPLRYFGFKKDYCPEDEGIPDVRRPSYANYRAFLNLSQLSRLKNLQTVNISNLCKRDELPMSFWENKLLRHVIVSPCCKCKGALDGPPSAANLPNLLTLKGVNPRQEWGKKLPHFPHLCKLAITIPDGVAPEPIVNSLSNLQDLGSLYLVNESDNQLTFPCALSNERLYSLSLNDGRWPKQDAANHGSIFPPHLMELTLETFHFEEDPMTQLEKLPNLTVLKINGVLMTADGNPRITCSRKGFGRLQKLAIHVHKCEEWKIEKDAMPVLKTLELEMCIYLRIVPDLQHLTNLQELEVKGIEDGLKSTLQGDDQYWRIKHISSVTFY